MAKCELTYYAVEVIGLFGIRLVERLGTHLEAQVLHCLEDVVVTLEGQNVLVTDGVVALLVVQIHQRGNLRELVGNVLHEAIGH